MVQIIQIQNWESGWSFRSKLNSVIDKYNTMDWKVYAEQASSDAKYVNKAWDTISWRLTLNWWLTLWWQNVDWSWNDFTPTLSWPTWSWASFSDFQWKYKIIWKTCFVFVRWIINNKWTCDWEFRVSLPVPHSWTSSQPLAWGLQAIWWNIATPKWVPSAFANYITLSGVSWGYRWIQWSEIATNDFFLFNWCYSIA